MARRTLIAAFGLVLALVVAVLLGKWGWGELIDYINPKNATDRKDAMQAFVLIVAGVVGIVGAVVGLANVYFSRRNLEQQRELETRQRQATALQTYYAHIGKMLTEQNLRIAKLYDDVRLLASAQTSAVLSELDGQRKRDLVMFLSNGHLMDAPIVGKNDPIINLGWADLGFVDLRGLVVSEISFSCANLDHAVLNSADLSRSDLEYTRLHRADLRGADLRGADLHGAEGITSEQLERQARSLQDATMPDGQKYEDWRKSKDRGDDRESSHSS
jgi:uncharacterized protein YjbI with pentapeptide repeats